MGKFEINTQYDCYTHWFNLFKYTYINLACLEKKLELTVNKKHKAGIWEENFIKFLNTEQKW
jgi:hypothetical protein